ncbi:MAG: NAD/NADP octopine/nopaline dehydrogenase family protein, partial [Actinobacteria bacterium]|nr:NAD/NADP octopine/nopaline dehydrogenase family protein [Actinomycetota bacterium]
IDWLSMAYNVVEDSLFDAIHSNPGYVGIMAPRTTNVRYITEDVPMSLVPTAEFGRLLEVETPVIDSLINIADSIFKKDFRSTGRNLKSLGLEGLDLEKVRKILINGW